MNEAIAALGELLKGLSRSDWIAFGALVVSVFATWHAARGTRVAKDAYALSLDAHRRSQPSLDLYLVEAFIRPTATPPRRICVFRVRVTNQSDAPNGLKAATLRVDYAKPGEPSSNLVIQHDPNCAEVLPQRDRPLVQVPESIAPRAVVGGLWLFPIPDELIRGRHIESYTVSLTDSYNREVEHEALLLREVRDEMAKGNQGPDQARG
jgi:hypothetical protein